MDGPVVVIDNGTGTCKAGIASEKEPRFEIKTVIGKPKSINKTIHQLTGLKECYVGQEAISKRGILVMREPIKHGRIIDWDSIENLWHHIFQNELKSSPNEHSVLTTVSSLNDNAEKEGIAQIMFEKFGVPRLSVYNQAVLALYNSGKTSGVVVDSGHGSTNIVPIWNGIALSGHSKKFDVNGYDLTSFMHTMLIQRGYSLDIRRDLGIITDMKEKLCYSTLNFEAEMNPASESSSLDKTYQLPDGNVITIGNERFRCPEVMFQPKCLGKESLGFQHALVDSIMSCDEEMRKELFRNVVLAGGNTLFNGMSERLKVEMKLLAPPLTHVIVDAPPDRKHSAWIGGSITASLPSFQKMWITKEEYDEIGPAVCQRM